MINEDFSFKQFKEEFQDKFNMTVFTVSGTFKGQPFKKSLMKPLTEEGYSKKGIQGEVAELVLKEAYGGSAEPDQATLDGLAEVKEMLDTAQRLLDALDLDESVGYFVATLRCKHKYGKGNYTECPMCGEIVS